LPPLRDRTDDILPLTQAFLTEFGRAFANPPAGISREAKRMLLEYHWPGNIRELRNILERAAILCDGGLITDDHLALPMATAVPARARGIASSRPSPDLNGSTAEGRGHQPSRPGTDAPPSDLPSMERGMIEQALQHARFNKSKAAKALGLTRHQLYIRMRRHGLAD
jgi:DNA-binding NtrC family response regulator